MEDDPTVVASALEVLALSEVATLLASPEGTAAFTDREREYAHSKSDPERRLAARLAAKRAALRLLGAGLGLGDVEVVRRRGHPPTLGLSAAARARLAELGAAGALVSLTHGQTHAAASVVLVREGA